MATRQRLRFVLVVVFWSTLSITLLAAAGVFSLELLVVIAFVGLLLTAEMTAPTTILPEWRGTVRRLLLVWGIVIVFIVGQRFVGILL